MLCLAVADAAEAPSNARSPQRPPSARALSLVHDDLPALDDDAEPARATERARGLWRGVALLAGDALLVGAFRLALSMQPPTSLVSSPTRRSGPVERCRDVTGDDDLGEVERLKTGRLFSAAVGLGLRSAGMPVEEHPPWRAFGDRLGILFQAVDDILDGDGLVTRVGVDGARRVADDAADRARQWLGALAAETTVLRELVEGLAVRTI